MARHGVTEAEILAGETSGRFRNLARAVADRARFHYRAARAALPAADRRSMVAAELMGAVYWRLLRELESRDFPVLGPDRVRLGSARKLLLVLAAWLRITTGLPIATYG